MVKKMTLREAVEILMLNTRFTPKDIMDTMSAEKKERIRIAKARAIQYLNGTPIKVTLKND